MILTRGTLVAAILALAGLAWAADWGVPRAVYPVNVPHAGTASLKRAVDLWANAEHGKALKGFLEAATLHPRDAMAWHNLGVALQREKRFEEGLDAFTHERFLSPTSPGAYFGIGECLLALTRTPEAETSFVMAVVECPSEWRYWKALATAMRLQGKTEAAAVAERNAARLKPRRTPQFKGFQTTLRDILRAPSAQIPSPRTGYAQVY